MQFFLKEKGNGRRMVQCSKQISVKYLTQRLPELSKRKLIRKESNIIKICFDILFLTWTILAFSDNLLSRYIQTI